MTITLSPELAAVVEKYASEQGVEPSCLVERAVRQKFLPEWPIEPRDEWEERFVKCFCVQVETNPAATYSREEIYD